MTSQAFQDYFSYEKIVLTPNRRSSYFQEQREFQTQSEFQTQYESNNKQKTNTAVFPINTWVEQLYIDLSSKLPELPKLLTVREEEIIWENIIRQSDWGQTLLKTAGAARLAREAWVLCHQWSVLEGHWLEQQFNFSQASTGSHIGGHIDKLFILSEDIQAFLQWSSQYQQYCQDNHWIDFSRLAPLLRKLLQDGTISNLQELPKSIQLVGFEELTPQFRQLLEAFREKHVKIESITLATITHNEKLTLAADTLEEELRLAANQCQLWLQEQEKEQNQNQNQTQDKNKKQKALNPSLIGVVIPDLETRRQEVVRIFSEYLPKASFNVAAPMPFSEYPIIEAALLALSFLTEEIAQEKWSQFLLSPFFTSLKDTTIDSKIDFNIDSNNNSKISNLKTSNILEPDNEYFARAAIDLQFRQTSEKSFSLKQILLRLEKIKESSSAMVCSNLFSQLQAFNEVCPNIWQKKSTRDWCTLFKQCLEILGWPGARALNEEELELCSEWEQLLQEYEGIGRVLGEHTVREAFQRLKVLGLNKSFLKRSDTTATRVQVLGLLEAVGMPFDYLWIAGMHREAWPMAPAPNPFIPTHLQKAYDLPRHSSKRELMMARKFINRFFQSAPKVIFSYPLMIEDQNCYLTPLLIDLPQVNKKTLDLSKTESRLSILLQQAIDDNAIITKASNELITSMENKLTEINFTNPNKLLKSENAPPLHETEQILGGLSFLKLQALCPFRAFAEIRLQAKPLPKPIQGLTAAERGELVHQVLEHFWQVWSEKPWLDFKILTTESIKKYLQHYIGKVVDFWQVQRPSLLTPVFASLEKERLLKILLPFLILEQKRPPFKVLAIEKEQEVRLNEIRFKTRIDRIDQLETGEVVLIDYKTGETTIRYWFGTRPTEPQLPLYCILQESLDFSKQDKELDLDNQQHLDNSTTQGIVYAILRPEGVKYQGVAAQSDLLPGVKSISEMRYDDCAESWDAQQEDWKESIEKLAMDFRQGQAFVDPIQTQDPCRTCSLHTLCRISEKKVTALP